MRSLISYGFLTPLSILTRIHRMKWHPASSARQFRLVDQILKLDQVAESWRTRRVKVEAGGFASISAAFGPTGPIHPGDPGLLFLPGLFPIEPISAVNWSLSYEWWFYI